MKIAVLGAAGNVGSRVVAEALSRGHEVTAVVRNLARSNRLPAAAKVLAGDAGNVGDVSSVSVGQDVVISAIKPAPGNKSETVATTNALMDGLAQTGVRLLLVGGAATLRVPGTGGKTVVEDSNFLPVSARPVGEASADELLIDHEGNSRISMEDLAVVLVDEAEQPKHHRTRFTAAY